MDYHASRQTVLASNLAHIDTPGYAPKDLERSGSFASTLQATVTNEKHLSANHATQGKVVTTGEAVSLDKEAVRIAANNVRYDVVAQLVSAELGMLNYAATDGKGG